jgi:hypothetical protein
MGNAKHIGRVGALAVALGVMATSVSAAMASAADEPPPPKKSTALILCGTTCPTPDDYFVDTAMNQYIKPSHPGQTITPVKVTTPEELWPATGALRLLELALGPPKLGGLDGPAWPDEPLWKLSGLFDMTANQSLQAGAADLEDAIAENPSDHLIIYGYSQGAGVANVVKGRLAEQYPKGTPAGDNAPDVDFVLTGDPNLPNGGLMSRFAGLYIPILDFPFNGAARTDTEFDTVEISQKYDGFTDFPLYPLNVVADANAVLGLIYVHAYLFDVSIPADDPTSSPAYRGTYGDTSYYLFDNPDLPLFGPLRTLGVPEPVIDVFEPFFKVIVEQGYDRSIPAWEPTPARLLPPLNPAKVTTDLVDAVGEGIDNAKALIGAPTPLSKPAVDEEQVLSAPDTGRASDHITNAIGSVKAFLGNDRTIARSNGSDNDRPTASPTRKTPLRDAVAKASADIKKVVTQVSDNVKKALGGGARDTANTTSDQGADAAA